MSTILLTLNVEGKSVLSAIMAERLYQDEKWGTIEEYPHDVPAWLLILESELNEAKEMWIKMPGDREALREIVQLVAVGFACLEQHGAVGRFQSQ